MEQFSFTNSAQKLSKLKKLTQDELIQRCTLIEAELSRAIRELYRLKNQNINDEQLQFVLQEQIDSLQAKVFGRSSERYKKPKKNSDDNNSNDPKSEAKPRIKKLSDRYPHLIVKEQLVTIDPAPVCPCCSKTMTDSGMTEDSEQLTVIPKKYEILKIKRAKYRCSCHGAITTATGPKRIIEGSSYSDEMITDIAVSKYCDLIPINRYAAMAARVGLVDLPANSLIEVTHQFADFVSPVYSLIKQDILKARVINADETPHRMLEGDEKKSWYLWGFSTPKSCFLECHDTRSGDVASEILLNSNCEILVTDVYSGYGKAIGVANKIRKENNLPLIQSAHCNAHARRYFFKAWSNYKESEFYLDHYHEIYQLEKQAKAKPPPEKLEIRAQMTSRFKAMKQRALEELPGYPRNGKYGKALRYYLNNYETLTLFLTDEQVPIDNNAQERSLRSHVVGRKTWYGTHSKRGALTSAIMFSIVETCKLNQVNPREYFENLTQDLLAGLKPYTPESFKNSN